VIQDWLSKHPPGAFLLLRNALNFCLKDFTHFEINSIKPWPSLLSIICLEFPKLVDPDIFMSRSLSELHTADPKSRAILGCLIMLIFRMSPQVQHYLANWSSQMKDEQRRFWLAWLPLPFTVSGGPPIPFIKFLYQSFPFNFFFTYHHIRFSVILQDQQSINSLTDSLTEIDILFKFGENLEAAVRAHHHLIRAVMSDRTNQPIPADLSKCGRTFDDLAAFC
jgi:hypothetical protein